jgi:hypothetical protein
MSNTLEQFIQFMLDDGFVIERWSDGSLSCEVAVSNDRWKVFYTFEDDWIRIFAPLVRLKKKPDTEFLRELLKRNSTKSVTRFAATEDSLCLRADYPQGDFQGEEFRLVHRHCLEELRRVVTDLRLPEFSSGVDR